MLRSWIVAHRSLVATALSGLVIAALVATIAIVSTGYTAQKMNLGDGSVWVANGTDQVIGRANPGVLLLNTVVRGGANDLQVVQDGETVLLVDKANATLKTVDPSTSEVLDEIALPPQQPQVYLAGTRVLIFAAGTGELWIVPRVDLGGFDATSEPTLNLGKNASISVTTGGTVYAYLPDYKQVRRVDAARSDDFGQSWPLTIKKGSGNYQITSVGNNWAVLDSGTRILWLDGRTVDLSKSIGTNDGPLIQKASADADRVLIGTSTQLLSVPLSGAAPVPLLDGQSGSAAAPLVLDGCEYGAWTSGTSWRRCATDGGSGTTQKLDAMSGAARLDFAVNTDRVVLNDTRSGASWAVQENGELIDNWDDLIVQDEDHQQQENDQDVPPTVDEEQKPPVAVDDEFGARPGRSTLLPVLLNDYDPNADVLVITATDGVDQSVGHLDLVTRNQQLQLTLNDGVTGTITFGYTITDGRGGTASATVTVKVRTPGENSPPVQIRTTKTTVQEGGRISTQVVGDWIDPDGDAFYLVGAGTAAPDQVSFKPDGVVVFTDAGQGGSLKTVSMTMSDGQATGSGSLSISVKPAGEVPIVIEPWVALATAGQEITIRPMSHVRGGTGTLRLNAVPAKAGSTVEPSFEAGTFTFESDEVRTHYVEFTVTDGDQTATGVVRIDVAAPPDANTRPITVPKTVFVTTLSSQTVDPTTTDIDPAGGVLVVTGVSNVPTDGNVQAEILDQRQVRVTLKGPLDGKTVTFNYTISNGLADAQGTITVVELPIPAQLQPPLATDDAATVRVGDVIDIPVLDNDEQPDGEPITLEPELAQQLPDGAGLLFVNGDKLRYLAPQTAGNYTAVYSIRSGDQVAQARVTLSVREVDAATNSAPAPSRLTARVLAGEKVRIEVPLTGIDPDGDSVQLIGIASNPQKGSVLQVGAGFIEYEAGDYSSGTDEFSYTVTDSLGARAEGTVRVGISARLEGARNPVANGDEVTVKPGRTVSVQVLANDSDPDGSPLTVTSVQPNVAGTTAKIIDDSVIDITPPKAPGSYSVIYEIANQFGGTSSNFVNVHVDPNAPLAYPVAQDTVLAVSDVLDHPTVDVSVLDNVFFADGDVADLGVALVQGYSSSAQVLPNKRIRVTVGEKSQIIPFSVSHPDDDSVRSFAFIWVPGYADALPQLSKTAPPLKVDSEATLQIDLNDYVVALGGHKVRLADTTSVRATHADGSNLVVDADTLTYTSADQYYGPASITFEVTDGTSATDPQGKRAILTLPITVKARTNQPPAFDGGVVDFEPGQEKELDLVRLTNYPYDNDVDELIYSIGTPAPEGFSFELHGQRLVLRADATAVIGSSTSISIGVRDSENDGRAGKVTLQVVPSTRPLVKPVADRAVTQRGQTTTIDVLTNDEANNPFPETPLTVVDIRGISGGALPDGVSVVPSASKSRLTVTVAAGVDPQDINLQYEVADATNDPSRYVWGNATISIQDVPDAVTAVHVSEFGDRLLKLSWSPGQSNNSAITSYQVAMTAADSGDAINTTTCTTAVNCELRTPGNGPANAVRLSVVAINGIGPSAPTSLTGSIWSDIIPPPPTALDSTPLDQGLRITWSKPDGGAGSPIEQYFVTVGGVTQTVDVNPSDPVGTGYARNVQAPSIANGSAVVYSVSARNSAPNSLATWNQAEGTGIPAGPPIQLAAPTASASVTDGTTASIAWAGAFGDNGASIRNYYVAIYTGSAPTCSVSGVENGNPSPNPPGGNVQTLGGGQTSTNFGGLTPNQTYFMTVFAYNGQGCTASPQVQVTPRAAPGTVGSVSTSGPLATSASTWDFRLDSFSIGSGSTDADTFVYRLIGGSTDQSQSGVVSPGAMLTTGNGSQYGNSIGVQVKACKSYAEGTLCSANWSNTFPLGVPVNNSVPGGLTSVVTDDGGGLLDAKGYWGWGSLPGGPGYADVTFSCGSNDDPSTPQQCEVDGGLLGLGFPNLTITITANGTTYPRSYAWGQF